MITTHQLTVTIGPKTVCEKLQLTLQPGEICGILGPNGSGKTTLLHTLARLHPATDGDITLQGTRLSDWRPKTLARQRGMLFQDTVSPFSQTVLEYCLTGRHPYRSLFGFDTTEDIHIATAALRLMELDTQLSQAVQTLSGGERRRLAIATLLTQTPNLYLLDEPLNHLDIRQQMRVLTHFRQLAAQGATVIMALHDVTLAQHLCHQVILLFADGATLQGPADNILTTDNLSRLYGYPLQRVTVGTQDVWLPALLI